jgi:hypothetical protein
MVEKASSTFSYLGQAVVGAGKPKANEEYQSDQNIITHAITPLSKNILQP